MKFIDIIGQDAVKARLVKTVKESRVSHAQLFLGPEGSGKLALAIAYAQYINCSNRNEFDSCGECPSCIKYEKLIHPDLHFVYPTARIKEIEKPTSKDFIVQWRELLIENNSYIKLPGWYEKISIERKQAIINTRDCNDIIKTLSYKTYEADYKVMIIWMVEKLFHAAAPKILKILEEPPDKTLFILISEDQEQIIKTILSRTQLVKVPPIDNEYLIKELINENFEPGKINDAVKLAQGNYIEAKRLLSNPDVEEYNFKQYTRWMRLCFMNKMADTIEFANEMGKSSREKQKNFLNYSLRLTRECLLINNQSEGLIRLNKKETEFVYGSGKKKFYPYINLKNAQLIADELNQSVYHIERNVNPNILFLDLSLNIGKMLKI
jgi:DNA polymerase-3 subunit delta'